VRPVHRLISGPPLGRPPKDPDEYRRLLKGARQSEIERISIEGKFGNGKRKYGCLIDGCAKLAERNWTKYIKFNIFEK